MSSWWRQCAAPDGVSDPGSRGRRRTWAELLAGRVKRQKCDSRRAQELGAAAASLLRRHLALKGLLLEVEGTPHRELSLSLWTDPGSPEASPGLPSWIISSALQDQASWLGVPVLDLCSQLVASRLLQLCGAAPAGVLLSAEQRRKLASLLETVRCFSAHGMLSRHHCCQELWREQKSLALEAVWHLHTHNIVRFQELLESHTDTQALVTWLVEKLRLLCEQAEVPGQPSQVATTVLSDLVQVLVSRAFQEDTDRGGDADSDQVPQVAVTVLQRMLQDALGVLAAPEGSSGLKVAAAWLHVLGTQLCPGAAPAMPLKRFSRQTLIWTLTYEPVLRVSDALQMQRDWTFARTPALLRDLFRGLFVPLSAEELLGLLQHVLAAQEVNWRHVLSCVSAVVVCLPQAQLLVHDWVARLLACAFESCDLDSMVTAFLVVRQAALEGPAVSVSYADWFQASFGSAQGHHVSSKKALVFLFKFLAELVPYEGPRYLQVHLLHPPLVPSKHRTLLTDYASLARTRLADLQVPMEAMGLYEDLSTAGDVPKPHCQAQQDVSKAIEVFEHTGRIPVAVMEASIFRRPYFLSHFLPALLTPRVLPQVPDARVAFIEALKRADKIPPSLYSTYRQACSAAEDGKPETDAVAQTQLGEPLEALKAALHALREAMADPVRHEAVSPQLALVAERLSSAVGHEDEDVSRLQLAAPASAPEPRGEAVVDLLLTAFCQNVTVASHFTPPDRQGSWAARFAALMCGHVLLPAVLTRLGQLLGPQGPSLHTAHVLGLAALVVHLGEPSSVLPRVPVGARTLPDLLSSSLSCSSRESSLFCLRFCTAAISYSLCKSPSQPRGALCSSLGADLIKKFQFLVLRLFAEAREHPCWGHDTGLPWRALSPPSADWQRAALCLWQQRSFQDLLVEEGLHLTYRDWLQLEVEIQPQADYLSDLERASFQRWAILERFLPAPTAAGGCGRDLERACTALADVLLDSWQSSRSSSCSETSGLGPGVFTGNGGLLSRLQEMVADLDRGPVPALSSSPPQGHSLLQAFCRRLQALPGGWDEAACLRRQQELVVCQWVLVSLPPSLLVSSPQADLPIPDCAEFFHLVNSELRNICSHEGALGHAITAHFFRGLLTACSRSRDPSLTANGTLEVCWAECPLLVTSALLWWPRLEAELESRWARCSAGPLPRELQRLRETQLFARSLLSTDTLPPPPSPAWALAAALHFSVWRAGQASVRSLLGQLPSPPGEQQLLCLFFFSLMCLLSSYLAAQAANSEKALGICAEILGCLETRRISWLQLFELKEAGNGLGSVLLRLAPDQHIRLLPFAFYSLLPHFGQDVLLEEGFLCVAVSMYQKLTSLFLGGETQPVTGPGRHRQNQAKPVGLITKARLFLLRAIPQCPAQSCSNVAKLLASAGDGDPELCAALQSRLQTTPNLLQEPLLF
ncbi:Fanconi anemia group A protein isoform X1 [Sorex araneus]|uniref:Fanconi anemia group A protein isoform X1 n=1 Tax=Sorex araneus TaxID=42254 RepID=UPI0024335C45|nr:Fanconi anemia group A protein isoform X1 [Sorex araneus]